MIQKKLDKVTGYLYRIEFDYTTGKYFIIVSLPIHWIVKNQDNVKIQFLNIYEQISNFFRIEGETVDAAFDNLLIIIKHNSKLDDLQAKLAAKIADKKHRVSQEEQDMANNLQEQKNRMLADLEQALAPNKGIINRYTDEHQEEFGRTETGFGEVDQAGIEPQTETSGDQSRLETVRRSE